MNVVSRASAISKGLRYYYTGKQCKHKHLDRRYVSTRICVTCGRDWNRLARRNFDDSQKRERYSREAVWRENNKERLIRASRDWYKSNTDRGKQRAAKRKAIKHSVFVEAIVAQVVFDRDKGMCGICTKAVDPATDWEIDHIIPISKGGLHAYANVQLSHRKCNRAKAARMPVVVAKQAAALKET